MRVTKNTIRLANAQNGLPFCALQQGVYPSP